MLHRKGIHVVQKVHVVYVGICCINFKKIVSNEKYFHVVQKLKLVYIYVLLVLRERRTIRDPLFLCLCKFDNKRSSSHKEASI